MPGEFASWRGYVQLCCPVRAYALSLYQHGCWCFPGVASAAVLVMIAQQHAARVDQAINIAFFACSDFENVMRLQAETTTEFAEIAGMNRTYSDRAAQDMCFAKASYLPLWRCLGPRV